jgi:hypothetical protein
MSWLPGRPQRPSDDSDTDRHESTPSLPNAAGSASRRRSVFKWEVRTVIGKAPAHAWILTGLTCFLVGALVGEGWRQAAPPLVLPTVGVVVTVEIAVEPTATPGPTPAATGSTADPSSLVAACFPHWIDAPPCDRTDHAD